MNAMQDALLDPSVWDGLGFLDGWQALHGLQTVVEPATGRALGRVGMADAADVARAARSARRAQTGWAALPYERRAEIMRAAAGAFREATDEVVDWIVRESGSTIGKRVSKSARRSRPSTKRRAYHRSPSERYSQVTHPC